MPDVQPAAPSHKPDSSRHQPIESAIDRVVLYEDRCEVTRKVQVELAPGPATLLLPGVSPLVSAERIRVRVTDGPRLDVNDIRVQYRFASDQTPGETRSEQLREQLKQAEAVVEQHVAALRRARARKDLTGQLLDRFTENVAAALWDGGGDAQAIDSGITALHARAVADCSAMDASRRTLQQAQEKLDALRALCPRDDTPTGRLVCDLVLQVSTAGGATALDVSYVIPCGLWRPAHEAKLHNGTVTVTSFGTVWQRTGEDWDDVALTLSTARPGAGAELPRLDEDVLSLREKTADEKKRIWVSHRTETAKRARTDAGVPGVYDGGQARTFVVEGRVCIKSDGRPHRVLAGSMSSPAQTRLLARPDVARRVFRVASLHNASALPLLAGPVALLDDDGFVGTGEIAYVGPGDPFEISFGSDDRFTIALSKTRYVDEKKLGRDVTHFVYEVQVGYSGAESCALDVTLRFPVSELKQLKVVPSEHYCSMPATPDDNGHITTTLNVGPGERKQLRLGFHFEAGRDVIIPDPW